MSPWDDLQQLLNPWASGVRVHNLSKSTDSIMSLCCQAHGLSPSNVSKEKMKPQLLYCCSGERAGSRGWWEAPGGQIGWKMPESYVAINGIESTTDTCVGWGLCSDTVAVQYLRVGVLSQGNDGWLQIQGKGAGMRSHVMFGNRAKHWKGGSKRGFKMCYLAPTFGFCCNKQESLNPYGMRNQTEKEKTLLIFYTMFCI